MTHPSLIPWKSKEEWISLYNKAYSALYDEVHEAVEILKKWVKYMESGYRPGMDCTRGILNVAIRDKHIYPDTKSPAELHELQLMYSAEIMRFLNLVNDGTGKKKKKISMYGRAKETDIPDWVVNIRHQMAHGNTLPSIDALRIAVEFILKWLKEHYWEEEKNNMKETTVEDAKTVIEESLSTLLKIYVLLKEQIILGFTTMKGIQDPDVKGIIFGMNRFSLNEVIMRCRPWESKEIENKLSVNVQKLNEYTISRALFLVLRLLKQFIHPGNVYGINTIYILVEKMIDDSVEHNGMRCYVWSTFLKALHSWFKFPVLIKAMTDRSCENTGERAYQAGIWNLELCKALEKRFKVEYLQNTVTKETITGKFSSNKKKAEFINLDSSERKEFLKLLLKKNFNLIGQSDNKILACIFHRVEQKNPNLKHVLRLQDPIFPNHWELVDLIEYVALKPNDFSEHCLLALSKVMKWPLNSKSQYQLIKLVKIYRGECIATHKVKRVFKSSNLVQNHIVNMNEKISEEFSDLYSYIKSKTELSNGECTTEDSIIGNSNVREGIVKPTFLDKNDFVTHDIIPISDIMLSRF